MCGRFGLTADSKASAKQFGVSNVPVLEPHYNIAPSQQILGIREGEQGREAALFRWGLIPSWAKHAKIGYRLINARAETVATKPSFRSAFKKRRLIIPASYYFEWKQEDGEKQPYLIRLRNAELFGLAGVWEEWTDPQSGEVVDSCTIITTEANAATREVHDRMPVILPRTSYGSWLKDGESQSELEALLQSQKSTEIEAYVVTKKVNCPTYTGRLT